MEIRYLKLVKAIVEEGSITQAMNVLCLTQSALSHQLKELESQIGTKLFFRVHKKMLLTPAGQKLYDAATKVLAELDQVDAEIRQLAEGESGLIRLSTECYSSYHWLPSLLKKFNERYPAVAVELVFEATHHPIEKLLTGDLDLAVTSNPDELNEVEFLPLFCDEMFALVAKTHPWAGRAYILPEDFQQETLIIHSLPLATVSLYRALLTPRGLEPRKLLVLPLTEAMIAMVKADMGVVVMANWAMQPYLCPELAAVRINAEGFFRQQYMARLRNRVFPTHVDDFIKLVREEMQVRL